MNRFRKTFLILLAILPCLILTACGTITVSGRTFTYGSVEVDWGTASEEDKQSLFTSFQVANESELLAVLKTRNGRNTRFTTFGTDGKYATKNEKNEVLDSGYYKQTESVITLAETEEGLGDENAYTLLANDKGYIVTTMLDDAKKIFAKYQYVEQN